ncbi:hypothetical protein PHYBOEH_005273 [Phytophthora boehmeriae]|uniref:BRWD/PHIP N-terminal domain-containing protein n=1 Tax=Phytophthora boehmeriae TaxID=109152 RepID=A0A8T1WKD0_9STRA|nr:hypothetical protein PHYBOEH_005273 [Phytophthora boehmeriae]
MDDESGGRSPEREGDGAAPDLADQHPLPVNDSAVSNVSNARELLPALAAQEETVGTTDLPLDPPTEASDTAQEQEQQPTQPQVDESEVFFLIADFLKRRSTCQKAADTLIEELAEHQLLKCAVDWKGERKIATYEDYRLRHRDLAPGHLMELLKGAAATFPKSVTSCKDVKKSKEAKEEKRSLLMKSRVAKKLQLSEDERRKLAQQIVKELFAVRGVMKTLRVVEKVIKKYERYQQYTKVSRMEDLPIELQQMLMGTDDAGARTETSAEKVVTLAADVRALKQLFQLRQERAELEKKIEEMMNRAKKSELFQTTVRTGRNQMSLLRRREVSSYRDPRLPPSFVYSRIRRLKTLSGHLQIQAYCLAYDKLGKVVITGSDDRLVKIWSLATGDLLFTLRGHVGNITDLAVNCANTLLASSSDDKTVRIWELSTGAPVAVLVQQNDLPAVTLSDIDVPSIEPIALLKGHKGPVTTVVYNNKGDQIATASIKDSTTRIWRWKKKYKSLHASVLVVQEAIDHDDISAIYGVRGRKKAFPVVDTLAWTHDDTRLVTLHSVKLNSQAADSIWEQRIRVWDPTTGRLMMTLGAVDQEKKNGHINAVFALDTHPMDWRIVVTAGYDGRVFLWDISTGRMLKSFINLSPDSKPLSNLDGGFTPDGNGFCFTDQVGRLLIFGTGSGEQYSMTPVQQYFLHDYVMLVTDAHYNVLDRETQELPSLMPSGPLMDASLVQYPHQPPHLMSSQVPLTPEQYAENRRLRIQQCIESEIQCASFGDVALDLGAMFADDGLRPLQKSATHQFLRSTFPVKMIVVMRIFKFRRRDMLQKKKRKMKTTRKQMRMILTWMKTTF